MAVLAGVKAWDIELLEGTKGGLDKRHSNGATAAWGR